MKKNMKWLSIALSVVVLASCGEKKDDKEAVVEKPQVKIAEVAMQNVPQTETYTATVESDVKNNISPNAPYRIKRVLVDVGDRVSKGQAVVILDASTETQLSMQIQSQEANIKSAQAQLANQQVETNRTAELYKIGGASKSEYDAAQTQLRVQQMAVEAQQAQLKALRSQAALAGENVKLVSPITGVVTARNYDDGDMYGTGLPVLTVEQLSPVKLLVNISETYFKQVTIGMPIEVRLDAYEGDIFGGKVVTVYPTIDKATHTFPIEVSIPNSDQRVRPGMFARATVNFGDQQHVVIPDEALVKQIGAGDRYVYVYKDGKVSYNKVELGRHIGNTYEIISGVAPGSKVVIAGQSRLANGKEVEVVK